MATYFLSAEDSYTVNQPTPQNPWDYTQSGPETSAIRRSTVRSAPLTGYGTQALEWETYGVSPITNVINESSAWNQIRPGNIPQGVSQLFFGCMFKIIKTGYPTPYYPQPNGDNEGFDKFQELVGSNYRWEMNIGIRAANGSANTFQTFMGTPCYNGWGHFHGPPSGICTGGGTPIYEEYDSYWNNINGYGRGLTNGTIYPGPYYSMTYDRWYAVVVKIVFAENSGGAGEMRQWINGTEVCRLTAIKTCGTTASLTTHEGMNFFGTFHQPTNQTETGGPVIPAHKRQLKRAFIVSTQAEVTALGMFADPEAGGGGGDTTAPSAPTSFTVG